MLLSVSMRIVAGESFFYCANDRPGEGLRVSNGVLIDWGFSLPYGGMLSMGMV